MLTCLGTCRLLCFAHRCGARKAAASCGWIDAREESIIPISRNIQYRDRFLLLSIDYQPDLVYGTAVEISGIVSNVERSKTNRGSSFAGLNSLAPL